jgi:hypothetical protein
MEILTKQLVESKDLRAFGITFLIWQATVNLLQIKFVSVLNSKHNFTLSLVVAWEECFTSDGVWEIWFLESINIKCKVNSH